MRGGEEHIERQCQAQEADRRHTAFTSAVEVYRGAWKLGWTVEESIKSRLGSLQRVLFSTVHFIEYVSKLALDGSR